MLLTTFWVEKIADDGTANTLRWAIDQSNTTAGGDAIAFRIPGAQPATITLAAARGALPPITDPVFIDGWSQAQNPAVNMPQIEIDGSALGGVSGLVVNCGNTTIEGLAIDGFNNNGIELNNAPGSAGNLVLNCYIGCGLWGTSANSGNAMNGIFISGPNNDIGWPGTAMPPNMFGLPPMIGAWNVIAGNTQNGVDIFGAAAKNNTLSGNFIGVDATGFNSLANRGDGVRIEAGPSGNYVGTQAPAFGFENFISGNRQNGVSIVSASNNFVNNDCIGLCVDGKSALGNFGNGVAVSGVSSNERIDGDTISDNLTGVLFAGSDVTGSTITRSAIGTDYTGMLARGNGGDGVTFDGAVSNTIGGGMGQYNVISGNLGNGIDITGTLDKVYGNWIGTDATGNAALPNQLDGISIEGSLNTIGSPLVQRSNTISGNLGDGIAIDGDNNFVYGNSIGTNDAGTAAIANGGTGVSILGNTNHIGTATIGGGNLISGNAGSGVFIIGDSNEVYGDTIGTNYLQSMALANGVNGVTIVGDNNRVGTSGALVENLISGNANDGVYIRGANNKVYGNRIGTDFHGWSAISNGNNGVEVIGDLNEVGCDLIGGGNVISGNGNAGVLLNGNSNTVAQDWIGVDGFGDMALKNGAGGVRIKGNNNNIGIADATGRNVISGNGIDGVSIQGDDNVMLNNLIGVGSDGKTKVGNDLMGVRITGIKNTIGGQGDWDANVVSGNGADGIRLWQGCADTTVRGNYIGVGVDLGAGGRIVDIDNETPLGNGQDGIYVEKTKLFTDAAGANDVTHPDFIIGNTVCNNGDFGIQLGVGSFNCTVDDNWIGLFQKDIYVYEAPNLAGSWVDLSVTPKPNGEPPNNWGSNWTND